MGGYVRKKRDMVFQSVDSLQQIVNVVNEAAAAVNDSKRTIKESAIPEVLAGALGAGIGGVLVYLQALSSRIRSTCSALSGFPATETAGSICSPRVMPFS